MEIQKFRILRTNPDINWTIPCSGATDLWPLNTSNNCSGTTIYDTTLSEILGAINKDSEFPDKLKDCSTTTPGIIVDDTSYTTNLNFCSNIGGRKYLIFKGFNLQYNGSPASGSYNELSSVIEGFHTGTFTSLIPDVLPCTCSNPLGQYLNKLPIFVSQDYNDIGHYDIWDGNIGQQDTFGNFILSATSFTGYKVTVYRTTDIAYHAGVKDSTFTIDWGDGTVTNYGAASYEEDHTYSVGVQKQYRVIVTQDTPWGSKSVSNIVTIPHFTYPVMFNQLYSSPTGDASPITYPPLDPTTGGPGSGMTMGHVPLTGLATTGGTGTSSAYHGIYGSASTTNYFALDSATDIDQFSGLTFGPTSVFGIPCYTVSGITESILGNFQTYTSAIDASGNLPPGYITSVIVPIGGDVLNPITNTLETGVYGSILYAEPTVTAYTISSSYGASGGYANGDTPINLWDFSNGITIFEAESCGLDKRAFGAVQCIDCPSDDCMWCQFKDEYIDRTDGIAYEIPGQHPTMGLWDSTLQYNFGEIVYDITWNACCCYINVGGAATIIGISPSSMQEGVWTGIHMWEACSDDCISCPIGTQSPCNDTTLDGGHAYPDATSIPAGKASYYNAGLNYTIGDYVKGGNGNCYEATANSAGVQPTGSTTHWDYVGCVAWDCPTDLNASGCVMISGVTDTSSANWIDCKSDFDNDYCFLGKWTCDLPYFQCGGCHEIFPGDPLYTTTSAYTSDLLCLQTCSPPAWSCVTPTSVNCCVSFNCTDQQGYIDNVGQAYIQDGNNPGGTLDGSGNWDDNGLFVSSYLGTPLYQESHCKDECCVYSSYTWNCEQGCISQNGPGGWATFAACVIAVNNSGAASIYNPHFGEINPLTGAVYVSDGYGNGYDMNNNNVPCGWSCEYPSEIYNPIPPDPFQLGNYQSPCDPCYTLNCGDAQTDELCVTVCSALTTCYICDCLALNNCNLVLECPTFTDLNNTSLGANNGVDTGLYLSYTAGIYHTTDDSLLGPLFTYSSSTACTNSCPCGGWDCVVYRSNHNMHNPLIPQADVGLGCDNWTDMELNDNDYQWSQGNPDGTAYTTFNDCCVANPECCEVACVDCIQFPSDCSVECTTPGVPVGCNATYPCQYHDGNLSPYPTMYVTGGNVPAMVDCLINVFTHPNTGELQCDLHHDCECACFPLLATWVNNIYFNTGGGGVMGTTTGLTLNHMGDWDQVLPGSIETYESGATIYHEQPVAYSVACCYVCACVEGVGMFSMGVLIGTADCNEFEPGTGVNAGGQPNCWIDCGSATSFPGEPCDACTPSPNSTWECDETGAGAGCVSSSCSYQAPGMSTTWATQNNCYLTSDCNGECYHGCGCNTTTQTSECVKLQDVLNGIQSADIFPIPTNYPYPHYTQCQTILALPTDCCDPYGVSYNCDGPGFDCSSDPNTHTAGPGAGCVEIDPSQPLGTFHSGALTWVTPGGTITFATALEACEAMCTWTCKNNDGCKFDAWEPFGTFTSAYDCWSNTGMDCTNCDETYFCYSGYAGATNIITESDLAALGVPDNTLDAHTESLGPGGLSYFDNQNGFPTQALCQDFCRFTCNSAPGACGCELDWGNIGASANMLDCGNLQVALGGGFNNCCYAEWWCEPIYGCKGYMTNQLVTDLGASNGQTPDGAPAVTPTPAGPYYQINGVPATDTTGNPGTGEAGCKEYCGYACGDGWEQYLAECTCMQVYNEWDASMYNLPSPGDGVSIVGQAGIYDNLADCTQAGSAIGGIGCCNCYNCIQATVVNDGVTYPMIANQTFNTAPTYSWDTSGAGQCPADITATDTQDAWDGTGGQTYNHGDVVIHVSGTTDCCYVYNGCCDPAISLDGCAGQSNLLCSSGFTPSDWDVNPWEVWWTYKDAIEVLSVTDNVNGLPPYFFPTFTGMILVNVAGNTTFLGAPIYDIYGVATGNFITATDIWTAGPNWVPCDQGCPQP